MNKFFLLLLSTLSLASCQNQQEQQQEQQEQEPAVQDSPEKTRIPVILDTDANNELDDQHAIAYLLFNQEIFDVFGITVNATMNGGDIDQHYLEARRMLDLCDADNIPLVKGANDDYADIIPDVDEERYDGKEAVDFIIRSAREINDTKLVLIPIGKLTNIALALQQAPDIREKVRIVWLGSNYPEPGEYNQDNDTTAMNYILNTDVPFEMVTVRYGKPSGSDAVRVTPEEINEKMAGKGPAVEPVEGRHGGTFTHVGDYFVSLFSNIDLHGDPPSRALFDVVAVAVLKDPSWGQAKEIPAPILVNNQWEERPDNPRKIIVWENFDTGAISQDFFSAFN